MATQKIINNGPVTQLNLSGGETTIRLVRRKDKDATAPTKPTREQLIALLFSDAASEAWERDALGILCGSEGDDQQPHQAKETIVDRVQEAIEVVGTECDAAREMVDGESDRDDLEALACGAKRGAILLLHSAWAAEQAAKERGGLT